MQYYSNCQLDKDCSLENTLRYAINKRLYDPLLFETGDISASLRHGQYEKGVDGYWMLSLSPLSFTSTMAWPQGEGPVSLGIKDL